MDFEGYFEREADSPKLLESLESESRGRNRTAIEAPVQGFITIHASLDEKRNAHTIKVVSGLLCSTKTGAPACIVAEGDRECRLVMTDMNGWGRRRPRFRYLKGSIIAACREHLSNGAEGWDLVEALPHFWQIFGKWLFQWEAGNWEN
jgi:hypothetical protein